MADRYAVFRSLNAEILGISTDSIFSHKVFTRISPSARRVNYPLVADRTHAISRLYGVLDESTGIAYRATFIITPEPQTITFWHVYPREVGRNDDEIVQGLQGLQFYQRTGLGVPPGWQPGDPGVERDFDKAAAARPWTICALFISLNLNGGPCCQVAMAIKMTAAVAMDHQKLKAWRPKMKYHITKAAPRAAQTATNPALLLSLNPESPLYDYLFIAFWGSIHIRRMTFLTIFILCYCCQAV